MRHLKLTIAYDGAAYVGWQRQKNGIAVQQRMEESWRALTGESIPIIASGRTDSGVHARAQVCSIATQCGIPTERLARAFNAKTPEDISILKVEDAIEDFNAIVHCTRKTYCYQIQCGRILDPIGRLQAWFVPHHLDIEGMKTAAQYLVGQQDFASFQATGGVVRKTTVRNVMNLEIVTQQRDPYTDIRISITADGFLYNMVRNIVGTLVHVGRRSQPPEWAKWVLDQKDRCCAGQTAPAHGLFLENVVYPPETLLANNSGRHDDVTETQQDTP